MQNIADKRPKISFPCEYPIKVIGISTEGFENFVIETAHSYDKNFSGKITVYPSKNKKYISIRLTITATGESQIKGFFEALKKNSNVQMVL